MEPQKRGKNAPGRYCCVPGCFNTQKRNSDLIFYCFPNRQWEVDRKKKWVHSVRRLNQDKTPWMPTTDSRICSKHFAGGQKSNNPLNESYNPTIFPWTKVNPSAASRAARAERRSELKNTPEVVQHDTGDSELHLETSLPSFNAEVIITHDKGIQTDIVFDDAFEEAMPVLFCWNGSGDASTQTSIPRIQRNATQKIIVQPSPVRPKCRTIAVGPDHPTKSGFHGYKDISDEKSLKQLSGIPQAFFSVLLTFIKPNVDGQPKYFVALGAEDRLLLFLMKMKLGSGFSSLGTIFKISRQTAANVFYSVLETLFNKTKTWIFWPSKEAVKECLPAAFRNYPNCRAIIDCTELRCETPPTVEQRALMYSSYKSGFTVKFLVAITPSGYISFISKGYGGQTTDSYIVNDSGFIKLIEKGDEIMADKGFPEIKTELLKHESVLIMPPFAVNPQFSREEVLEGYSIASRRIHVERSIQRIRMFKALDHVTINILPYIDKIMYMACVLANSKEPLIRQA